MNDTTAQTAPRAAAQWWARQIANPTFKVTTAEEDRAGSAEEFLGTVMVRTTARMLADAHPVTPEQAAAFTDALEAIIIRDTDEAGWHYGLHVDYHPDPALAEAAKTAGIDESRFPYKTHLWLHQDGSVTARLGYGAPERLVWAPQGWDRPPCSDLRREQDPASNYYDVIYHPQICGRPKYHDGDCGDWAPDTAPCDRCGKTRADHWNAAYADFGHAFGTSADA